MKIKNARIVKTEDIQPIPETQLEIICQEYEGHKVCLYARPRVTPTGVKYACAVWASANQGYSKLANEACSIADFQCCPLFPNTDEEREFREKAKGSMDFYIKLQNDKEAKTKKGKESN
jgi:hypothetical protein